MNNHANGPAYRSSGAQRGSARVAYTGPITYGEVDDRAIL